MLYYYLTAGSGLLSNLSEKDKQQQQPQNDTSSISFPSAFVTIPIDEQSPLISWQRLSKIKQARVWIGTTVESRGVQLFLFSLIVVDLLILIADLIIEARRDEVGQDIDVPLLDTVLRWISISILFVFSVEQLLLMFAFGWRFFLHPFYVVDTVMLIGSLIIEIMFQQILAGFLVLIRLWRVARIIHGVVVAIKERHEQRETALLQKIMEAEAELNRGRVEIARQKLNALQHQLQLHQLQMPVSP